MRRRSRSLGFTRTDRLSCGSEPCASAGGGVVVGRPRKEPVFLRKMPLNPSLPFSSVPGACRPWVSSASLISSQLSLLTRPGLQSFFSTVLPRASVQPCCLGSCSTAIHVPAPSPLPRVTSRHVPPVCEPCLSRPVSGVCSPFPRDPPRPPLLWEVHPASRPGPHPPPLGLLQTAGRLCLHTPVALTYIYTGSSGTAPNKNDPPSTRWGPECHRECGSRQGPWAAGFRERPSCHFCTSTAPSSQRRCLYFA